MSVGSVAGCQSSGFELEPKLGQHHIRCSTTVTLTFVIRLQPMGYQSMGKVTSSLENIPVWSEYVNWLLGVICLKDC